MSIIKTTDQGRAAELLYLDPTVLIENPNNPRSSLGDLDELTASIREAGVLEPLIVVPREVGAYMVQFGHRRRAAAIEAGVEAVPCWVRPDYVGKTPSRSPTCWPRTCTEPT